MTFWQLQRSEAAQAGARGARQSNGTLTTFDALDKSRSAAHSVTAGIAGSV